MLSAEEKNSNRKLTRRKEKEEIGKGKEI